MSNRRLVPYETTLQVRDTCLCLHLQRAARVVARKFDEVFRPLDITQGQFSLLMSLNRPEPPTLGSVAGLLAMDRTTLTANLKPLERRGLVRIKVDPADRRSRRLALDQTRGWFYSLLAEATPIWKRHHAALERQLKRSANALRADLIALSR